MTTGPISQKDLQCAACGGQCVFAPETGTLTCTSCTATYPIKVDPEADPAAEFHYDPDLPHTEQTRVERITTHACETCGGEVVFTGPSLSERCPYCDGPVVMKPQESSYQTMGVIPFQITAKVAQTRAIAWAAARYAAPGDLTDVVAKARVAGIYVPFWTFDSREVVRYSARYKVKRGKKWTVQTTKGELRHFFDDLLVPASHHVTPLIRDGILHEFDPSALRTYEPAYLSGFAAERHHQTLEEGIAALEWDKDILLRNRIKQDVGRSGVFDISYKTHTSGTRYRRILLPVWILHYTYAGKPKKIVTCGLHGRTFGERPFSMRKLAGFAGVISAAVIAFGWAWGAARLP